MKKILKFRDFCLMLESAKRDGAIITFESNYEDISKKYKKIIKKNKFY